jgi:hypothetical protein
MELDLQNLFGLLYTAVLIGSDPATLPPPPPPHLGSYTVREHYWSGKIDGTPTKRPVTKRPVTKRLPAQVARRWGHIN